MLGERSVCLCGAGTVGVGQEGRSVCGSGVLIPPVITMGPNPSRHYHTTI